MNNKPIEEYHSIIKVKRSLLINNIIGSLMYLQEVKRTKDLIIYKVDSEYNYSALVKGDIKITPYNMKNGQIIMIPQDKNLEKAIVESPYSKKIIEGLASEFCEMKLMQTTNKLITKFIYFDKKAYQEYKKRINDKNEIIYGVYNKKGVAGLNKVLAKLEEKYDVCIEKSNDTCLVSLNGKWFNKMGFKYTFMYKHKPLSFELEIFIIQVYHLIAYFKIMASKKGLCRLTVYFEAMNKAIEMATEDGFKFSKYHIARQKLIDYAKILTLPKNMENLDMFKR